MGDRGANLLPRITVAEERSAHRTVGLTLLLRTSGWAAVGLTLMLPPIVAALLWSCSVTFSLRAVVT